MQNSDTGSEERSRLSELWSYDIIDTPPDPQFDDLVTLALDVCRVPAAAISLIDVDRLWFKSIAGLEAAELRRGDTFCEQVLAAKATVTVSDGLADARFRLSELVVGPARMRAYLGHPLMACSGAVLGTFCVMDTSSREWSAAEVSAVRALAAQAVTCLELRRSTAELTHLWEDHRALETRALTASRDDQRRLAAELHDGLGQDLTGLSLIINTIRRRTAEASIRTELLAVEKIMRGAIDSCRRLARGHMVYGFVHASLRESLDHYLASINETSTIRCELRWLATRAIRNRSVAYNLYRIAQEAVTNALRHSGANIIRVTASEQDGRFSLQVDDDGTGMNAVPAGERGIGLETMRFRAAAIGADLRIAPGMPRGLSVRCELNARDKPIAPHIAEVSSSDVKF